MMRTEVELFQDPVKRKLIRTVTLNDSKHYHLYWPGMELGRLSRSMW